MNQTFRIDIAPFVAAGPGIRLIVTAVEDGKDAGALSLELTHAKGTELCYEIQKALEAIERQATRALTENFGDEADWKFTDCRGCAIGPIPHPGPCLNADRMNEKNRRYQEAASGAKVFNFAGGPRPA